MRQTNQFDYETYIQERLREIDDIRERKFAKELLLDGLSRMFDTMEEKYARLEQHISAEIEPENDRYEVATTIISRDSYDPLNEFLFPVCPSDTESGQNPSTAALTVYLEADDQTIDEFLRSQYITGKSAQDHREIKFRIRKCRRYEDALAGLYQLFTGNGRQWNTVHTGYLERFFDLIEPEDSDPGAGAAGNGEARPIIEWGRWQPYVREDRILLWNISTEYYETGNSLLPCDDRTYYECAVKIDRPVENGWLFEVGGSICDVIYERNRVIIRAVTDQVEQVKAYQIHNQEEELSYRYDCPLFTNRRKGSFCSRYLHKNGVFLQTRADLVRKITELSGLFPVVLSRCEFADEVPAGALSADMNTFIREEVFPMEKRRVFILSFKASPEPGCYYRSQVRYILSQLQLEYLEYKCVGVIGN